MRLIYLASPYNHKDRAKMHERVSRAAECLAHFRRTADNIILYSPVVHWSRVAFEFELPHDFDTWAQQDFFMIRQSSALWILTIDGWKESYGLAQELEFARDIAKPVMFVIPEADSFHITDVEPT